MDSQHPLAQVLRRALWILAFILFSLWVLLGAKMNFVTIDYLRLYGFCVILSTIVQLFKKPSQHSSRANQTTYLEVVTELLQGNQSAAIRLFNYNKEKFGGKSDEWLWQKVIRDIERDRR